MRRIIVNAICILYVYKVLRGFSICKIFVIYLHKYCISMQICNVIKLGVQFVVPILLTFLSVLVRSVTQFLDKCSNDQVLMSFSLTFTMRSLKLIVFVTDSFETFEYNGIVRTKGVMPYSLFGDFLLL